MAEPTSVDDVLARAEASADAAAVAAVQQGAELPPDSSAASPVTPTPASNGTPSTGATADPNAALDAAHDRLEKLERLVADLRNSPGRGDPEMERIIEENLIMSEARVQALVDRREGEKKARRLEAQQRADKTFGLTRGADGVVRTITTITDDGQQRQLTTTAASTEVLEPATELEKEKERRLKAEAELAEARKARGNRGSIRKKVARGLGLGPEDDPAAENN